MKKFALFIFSLLCFNIIIQAQIPEKFNYQGILRNSSGDLIENTNISVKLSILAGSASGDVMYSESHSVSTNDFGQFSVQVGGGSVLLGVFSAIDWSQQMYLKTAVANPAGGSYTEMGAVQLISVPYSLYSNKAKVLDNNALYFTNNDTLFAVKDHDGNIVFAVFPDGAKVYVNEVVKGSVGGFAVSGRSPTKLGEESDYFLVTLDSTRIYINDVAKQKGSVGGFAVSGRSPTKGITSNFLQVLPDSTRIFVKDSTAGFGISNMESGTSESFLNLNKQNYLIGHQTGANIVSGVYNSMLGYQAGFNTSYGSNNLFLGYRSGYMNSNGGNNVFIGTESGYHNQNTFQNTYVGYRSGYELSGASNTMFGSMAGENAGGGNNTFIGSGAGRIATGGNNTFVGEGAGYGFPDENTGIRNTYIGQAVGAKTTTGSYNVMLGFNAGYLNYAGGKNTFLGYQSGNNIHDGSGNIFIGYEAGKNLNGISNRLVIENSSADSTTALIYGEFDQNDLRINGNVGINYPGVNNYGLIIDVPSGQTSTYTLYVLGSAFSSGGTWAGSDLRLKKNIETIQHPIDIVKSMRGVNFNWRTEDFPDMKLSTKNQIGFIAQELELVLPEMVSEDQNGYKAVAYDKISAVIVEAIKEQQNQIESLKNENIQLKSDYQNLKQEIDNIKAAYTKK